MEQEIVRLIHISDLHFIEPHRAGRKLQEEFDSLIAAPPPIERLDRSLEHFPWFKAALGHSEAAVGAFRAFWRGCAEEKSETPILIFTGDLTAFGNPEQFEVGMTVLDGKPSAGPFHDLPTMPRTRWRAAGITGNHDFFPAEPSLQRWRDICTMWRKPPRAEATHVVRRLKIPFVRGPFRVADHYLVLLGLDSDADVWNSACRPLDRALARGNFASQLVILQKRLRAFEEKYADLPNQIRILLTHHSPMYGYLEPPGISLWIDPDCRDQLFSFLERNRIATVLTGHIHGPSCDRLTDQCWELRAPSATQCVEEVQRHKVESVVEAMIQRSPRARHWPNSFKRNMKRRIAEWLDGWGSEVTNGFLEHRLVYGSGKGGSLTWKVEPYLYENGSFVPSSSAIRRGPIFNPFEIRAYSP